MGPLVNVYSVVGVFTCKLHVLGMRSWKKRCFWHSVVVRKLIFKLITLICKRVIHNWVASALKLRVLF